MVYFHKSTHPNWVLHCAQQDVHQLAISLIRHIIMQVIPPGVSIAWFYLESGLSYHPLESCQSEL